MMRLLGLFQQAGPFDETTRSAFQEGTLSLTGSTALILGESQKPSQKQHLTRRNQR
jgi:hypothetical protein